MRIPFRVLAVALSCLIGGLALSLILFVFWLHAPHAHVVAATQYFLASGLISLGAGLAALFIITRFASRLSYKVAIASIFGSVAAIINIVLTPLMMFSQRSDFDILVITLLYFVAISLAFASIFGYVTTRQIRALAAGATELAEGRFGATVLVEGADEIAELGRAFNNMSTELDESFRRRRRLEEERRDLVASVSHDLRTPLASIRAMVEALQDGVVDDPESVRRYHRTIGLETERLANLIDDLFELSRIESGTLELELVPLPMGELVAETVDGLRIQAEEKSIELRTSYADHLPLIALDAPQMQRVMANLLQNAIRHTPPGGRIDVAVMHKDGRIQLEVADSGDGIPIEDQTHIFERFFRGEKSRSRETGGAGLGLAIAHGIVEAHHGTISVVSEPGAGARFVVSL